MDYRIPAGAALRLTTCRAGDRDVLVAAGSAPRSLRTFDLKDPAHPAPLGALELGTVVDVAAADGLLYACSLEHGLLSVDLGAPAAPKRLHQWRPQAPGVPCAVGVMPPTRPQERPLVVVALRARLAAPDTTEDFFAEGMPSSDWEPLPPTEARDVTGSDGLGVYALVHSVAGDKAGFRQAGGRPYPKLNQVRYQGYHQPWEVAVMGRTALVALGRTGLGIFDLSRLDLVEQPDGHQPGARLRGVKLAGPYAVLTGDGPGLKDRPQDGLQVVDLTNPKQPAVVHPWLALGSAPAVRCLLLGATLLVLEAPGAGAPAGSLASYELAGAAVPRRTGSFPLPLPSGATAAASGTATAPATDLAAVPGHVYVADEAGRVTVLTAHRPELLGGPPTFEVAAVLEP